MSQITREQMLQVFENRCSTRYYDPNKKISQEDFAAILEFARLSPSSVGSEPWKFLVIQNKALRDKLKPFSWGMQYQLDDCSHLVIILAKKNARYDTPFFRATPKPCATLSSVRNFVTTCDEVKSVRKPCRFMASDFIL